MFSFHIQAWYSLLSSHCKVTVYISEVMVVPYSAVTLFVSLKAIINTFSAVEAVRNLLLHGLQNIILFLSQSDKFVSPVTFHDKSSSVQIWHASSQQLRISVLPLNSELYVRCSYHGTYFSTKSKLRGIIAASRSCLMIFSIDCIFVGVRLKVSQLSQ